MAGRRPFCQRENLVEEPPTYLGSLCTVGGPGECQHKCEGASQGNWDCRRPHAVGDADTGPRTQLIGGGCAVSPSMQNSAANFRRACSSLHWLNHLQPSRFGPGAILAFRIAFCGTRQLPGYEITGWRRRASNPGQTPVRDGRQSAGLRLRRALDCSYKVAALDAHHPGSPLSLLS